MALTNYFFARNLYVKSNGLDREAANTVNANVVNAKCKDFLYHFLLPMAFFMILVLLLTVLVAA